MAAISETSIVTDPTLLTATAILPRVNRMAAGTSDWGARATSEMSPNARELACPAWQVGPHGVIECSQQMLLGGAPVGQLRNVHANHLPVCGVFALHEIRHFRQSSVFVHRHSLEQLPSLHLMALDAEIVVEDALAEFGFLGPCFDIVMRFHDLSFPLPCLSNGSALARAWLRLAIRAPVGLRRT